MLEKRIIPILLLDNGKLLKGENFNNHKYVGDPINTVHLFNEKQVSEIILLDIGVRKNNSKIQYEFLKKLSSEAFLPITYGGGIDNIDEALRIVDIGFEKIVINSAIFKNFNLISDISASLGSQSVVVSIDVKLINQKYYVFSNNGKINTNILLEDHLKHVQDKGAGEIIITSIDKEGKMEGYDFNLIDLSLKHSEVPLIINGGAKNYDDFNDVFKNFEIAACAASSVFLFIGKYKAVLISYPSKKDLKLILSERNE